MRYASFDTRPVTRYGSSEVEVRSILTRAVTSGVHVSVLHFTSNGVVGEHLAPSWQLMVLLGGRIQVSTSDEARDMEPGDAVQWSPGENHLSRALQDATVLILEGAAPFLPSTNDRL